MMDLMPQKLNVIHIRNGNKTFCIFWNRMVGNNSTRTYDGDVVECNNECSGFKDCFQHCPHRKRLKKLEYYGDSKIEKNEFNILKKINSLRIGRRYKEANDMEQQYVLGVVTNYV